MRIIFLGDIVGRIGVLGASDVLDFLRRKLKPDFVIVNGENASKGKGLTEHDFKSLVAAGADCVTLGNHYRSKDQIDEYIDDCPNLIRPLNLIDYKKGVGSATFDVNGVEVQVTNLLGQSFMKEEVDNPIESFENLLDEHRAIVHIVDYHAEASSEKAIFAHYFDGIVTAVLGTHTHVQTADAQILPQGTAFMTDVGYCGAYPSIIGFDPGSVIDKIVNNYGRFGIDDSAQVMVNGALLDIDEETGLAKSIRPLRYLDGKEWEYGKIGD
ncbi:MAG: YmdB family metallophosphoesterase [Bacilli bacterium]|nr:YmdB family metallophosphoesterase [Bacilli bacterium]